MNVATLGNCQTKVLQVFLRKFLANFNFRWICVDTFSQPNQHQWAKERVFYGENIDCIFDLKKSISFLSSADVIIYQKLHKETSLMFNELKIKEYAKPSATLISKQSFYYDPQAEDPMLGLRHRHKMNPVTIPVEKLMINNPLISSEDLPQHPNTYYYIELTREICKINKWPLPSYNDENFFIKKGWPHKGK